MRAQNRGLNIDQTVVLKPPPIQVDSTFERQTNAFKQEMLRESGIKSVTVSSSVPGEAVRWNAGGIHLIGADEADSKQYRVIAVDYDFLNAYELKLNAGRPFPNVRTEIVIFNEAGLKLLGLTSEAALGKQIFFWGDTCTVVGIAENFHQQSLREAYEPLILQLRPDVRGKISIKTASGDVQKTRLRSSRAGPNSFPAILSSISFWTSILTINTRPITLRAVSDCFTLLFW